MSNIYKKEDKVRVIDDGGADDSYIGQKLTIESSNPLKGKKGYYYKFKEVSYPLREDRLELIKDEYEVYC